MDLEEHNRSICTAGRQALICFLLCSLVFTLSFLSSIVLQTPEVQGTTFWGPALYFCFFNIYIKYAYKGFLYEISVRSALLGALFSLGIFLSMFHNNWKIFGLYIMVLSAFHFSEFLVMAISNPSSLSVDSFILNHSPQYTLAALASWIEFTVEVYFFPNLKTAHTLSALGVILCVFGEIVRKGAMLTAGTNFTHTVQYVRNPNHILVDHGIYSLCRHPSYVGWFYWSIGTQIILLNPICAVGYTLASWCFFKERVFAEEAILLSFFGPQYRAYQERVKTGLPFIKGCVPENTAQQEELSGTIEPVLN